jgi:hypothetical protein
MSIAIAPWDLQTDDNRTADRLRTFIIFCEDEHHECLYFQSFEKTISDLKVNAIPNVRSKKLNLNATIDTCVQKGLMGFEDNRYVIVPGTTENIWCVYDRDMESRNWNDIRPSDHIDFDTAIMAGERAGLKIAWSNDVFELWLLLHFEDVPTGSVLHRDYVYERLTDIFKNQLDKDAEMEELTANETFNYKQNMKRRDRFIGQVIPNLKSRTVYAIERARRLEAMFNPTQQFHLRNPCTMVHHIVLDMQAEQK